MKNSGHNKIRLYVGGLVGLFWLIKKLIFVLFKIMYLCIKNINFVNIVRQQSFDYSQLLINIGGIYRYCVSSSWNSRNLFVTTTWRWRRHWINYKGLALYIYIYIIHINVSHLFTSWIIRVLFNNTHRRTLGGVYFMVSDSYLLISPLFFSINYLKQHNKIQSFILLFIKFMISAILVILQFLFNWII